MSCVSLNSLSTISVDIGILFSSHHRSPQLLSSELSDGNWLLKFCSSWRRSFRYGSAQCVSEIVRSNVSLVLDLLGSRACEDSQQRDESRCRDEARDPEDSLGELPLRSLSVWSCCLGLKGDRCGDGLLDFYLELCSRSLVDGVLLFDRPLSSRGRS